MLSVQKVTEQTLSSTTSFSYSLGTLSTQVHLNENQEGSISGVLHKIL